MKLLIAAVLIALAYGVELVVLVLELFTQGPLAMSFASFPLFFAGAVLTFAGASGPADARLKSHLDVCLVLTGVGVTLQAFTMSVYFDVAALGDDQVAGVFDVALPLGAAVAGLAAIVVLARGLVLRVLGRRP
ncbi:MAG: hypothetical protein NXI12_11390 [Alphaproteobacteria bacterium]|nr:hypothetical protein [Alphaproteobacteria bacterium]